MILLNPRNLTRPYPDARSAEVILDHVLLVVLSRRKSSQILGYPATNEPDAPLVNVVTPFIIVARPVLNVAERFIIVARPVAIVMKRFIACSTDTVWSSDGSPRPPRLFRCLEQFVIRDVRHSSPELVR